ncbi:MAG: methionine--tRNA ligase [Candidatus Woesearchaeota archaeon]
MKTIVTSALPYVNNIPHLGNMVCIISADVYTRFLKQTNQEVISVLGTDEHGTTTETVALQKGMTPKQVVDHYYKIHKEIYDWFGLEFDCFGRTSSEENHEIAQHLFLKLHENGYITEHEIEQYFDEEAQKFLSDRFIEGICPNCGYEDARGDQCDKCQKLLNSTDLINPRSKISGKKPILKKTTHLYIKLDELQPLLEKKLNFETWTENAITTTKAWLKEGLKERAITRDLKWGIQVPLKGFEDKVFYVWFDAPIGYISITKASRQDWKDWWYNDSRLVQFMGKDNIPFHSIMFPATIIGSKENITLVDTLNVNEYLNYEDQKFSKSRQIGVFGDDVMNLDIESDVWRYYLTINRPEKTDSNFYWKDLQEKNNTELLGNLGNLVNRTLTFINKYLDGQIPNITKKENYEEEIQIIKKDYEKIELKKALKNIMNLSKKFNAYFQEQEPWKTIKEEQEKAKNTLANLAHMIRDLAILTYPVLPTTSKKIYSFLGLQNIPNYDDLSKNLTGKISKPKTLFRKLEDIEIEELHETFSGKTELDLTVGKITSIKKHEEADKLYVEEIDLGYEKRQIVSGLVPYYKEEELLGKKVIIVTNLKPAVLRGQKSEGMLLAAGKKDVGILTTDLEIGTKLHSSKKEITIDEFMKIKLEYKQNSFYINGKKLTQNIKTDKNIEGRVK